MNFSKHIDARIKNSYQLSLYFLGEAKKKALSAVQKNKDVIRENTYIPKIVKTEYFDLPKIEKNVQGKIEIDEEKISKYMHVLRKTNQQIGAAFIEQRKKDRKQEKEAKKTKNLHVVRENLRTGMKNGLRIKIRQMRREKIFPLPKGFMNYKKRNGFLGKNTIKF